MYIVKVKLATFSQGWPEVSLFNNYYTELEGRALLLSLDCSTLPLIRTLYHWVLSKAVSSTIFKVFGMTRPGIEPRSSGPLTNTLPTWLTSQWCNQLHMLGVGTHVKQSFSNELNTLVAFKHICKQKNDTYSLKSLCLHCDC